jgi:hypothetical protein
MEHYIHLVCEGCSHYVRIGQFSSNPFYPHSAVSFAGICGETLIEQYQAPFFVPDNGGR